MNKKFYWLAGFTALIMTAACSDDNVTNDNPNQDPATEETENVVALQVLNGASQTGRIHMAIPTKAVEGIKKNRLNYVATITAPEDRTSKIWSATSILVDDAGGNTIYVTWHSDAQASTAATTWGGALDVINFENPEHPETDSPTAGGNENIDIKSTYVDDNVMKFEHVMKVNDVTFDTPVGQTTTWGLFLSATHAQKGAVVARIPGFNLTKAEIIGMPGTSVNAVTEYNGELIAVTGYTGTYAIFNPSAKAAFYDYEHPENSIWVTLCQDLDNGFGGKYTTTDEGGKAYVLRTDDGKAQIIDVKSGNVVVDNMAPLISEWKKGETYDPETGDWTINKIESQLQGKHVMVIKDGYAYVGAGQNGLRVYSLSDGKEVIQNSFKNHGPYTTGLCIDNDLLYAATGSGLRVYQRQNDGQLALYAFEVEKYEGALPDSMNPPTTMEDGTAVEGHHSANFVSVLTTPDNEKYIFVAYGQDGIRVFKLIPEPVVKGDEENEITE